MAGAASQNEHLSDGELSDDDIEKEENLDTSICKTCNLTFRNSRAFYIHIYSVSHLQKTSDLSSSCKPTSSSPGVPKSSFPVEKTILPSPAVSKSCFSMDTLCLNASFLSLPKPVRHDEYEDMSYDTPFPDFPQFPARSHHISVTENRAAFEPLCEGHWIITNKKSEDSGMVYSCETCGVSYREQLMMDLHMAGLRHIKNVEACEEQSSVLKPVFKRMDLNDMVERNANLFRQLDHFSELEHKEQSSVVKPGFKRMDLNDTVERNADLLRQLDNSLEPEQTTIGARNEPAETQEKKLNVADILSRNVNAFKKLSVYVEPVLGVDYISEFRFSSGQVEHVCNLCEASLTAPVSLTEHASSLQHLLRFIFYHDSSSFRLISLADKCGDLEFVRNVAADIESKQGRQLRTRVFTETTASPSGKEDSASCQWIEQKDDLIQPVSALPGHTANATYAFKRPPDETTQVTDVQSLLDTLANQSCIAGGKPPSLVKPVSRMDLLSSLAVFEISNDSDAEVSLQIANALTLALLNYRSKMIPLLKPSDRTKLGQKLAKSQEDAELIAHKIKGRHAAANQDGILP